MIKFPKVHIAQSVVNRILNVADDLDTERSAPTIDVPTVPDPAMAGARLDQALSAPPPAIPPPDGAEGDMAAAAITGSSPMDAAVLKGIDDGTAV